MQGSNILRPKELTLAMELAFHASTCQEFQFVAIRMGTEFHWPAREPLQQKQRWPAAALESAICPSCCRRERIDKSRTFRRSPDTSGSSVVGRCIGAVASTGLVAIPGIHVKCRRGAKDAPLALRLYYRRAKHIQPACVVYADPDAESKACTSDIRLSLHRLRAHEA